MNKITVKCPKCRLRFEVPGESGISEVQCNCPRCGTPFMAEVNVEDAEAPKVTPPPVPQHVAESQAETPHAETLQPYTPETEAPQLTTPPPIPHRAQKTSTTDQEAKKRGCLLRWWKILFLYALAGLVVYYCSGSSKSYTADDVEITDGEGNASVADDDAVPAPAFEDRTKDEAAPEWIQGTWHVDTDYGGITLKVHGDQVAETSAGETVYGRFRYQHRRLYCDFGAGDGNNDHVYTLNFSTKKIDAGQGLLMTKIE